MSTTLVHGDALKCGCVMGYYWCAAHDIYVSQDRDNDKRWTEPASMRCERSGPPTECSCHEIAPCSFCITQPEERAS